MTQTNTQINKAVLNLPFNEDKMDYLSKLFPLLTQMCNDRIKFHYLFLKEEHDYFSLRVHEEDEMKVIDLFKDLYGTDTSEQWNAYSFDEKRFGNVETHLLVDEFLSDAHRIIHQFIHQNLEDFDYGNLLTDSVFIFYHFANGIIDNEAFKVQFHNLFFENWKYYLPKGIGRKEIMQSWKEEIGILRSVLENQSLHKLTEQEQNLFQEFGTLSKQLKNKIEALIESGTFLERDQKFKYAKEISNDTHQSKFEILSDMLHFVLNAYLINNEDEALICLLSESMLVGEGIVN